MQKENMLYQSTMSI